MAVGDLPALNATLNGIAAVLLVIGYVLIRQRRWRQHRAVMLAAFTTSVLFLISYVTYHANAGSRPFTGQGPIRLVYFSILISHVILAAAIVPLALVTLSRGLRARYDRHARIARWTLPIWLYVSVTGVVVYLMLYRM
jgi:uncharacterized membrane protein YozB (DUF420 family)